MDMPTRAKAHEGVRSSGEIEAKPFKAPSFTLYTFIYSHMQDLPVCMHTYIYCIYITDC